MIILDAGSGYHWLLESACIDQYSRRRPCKCQFLTNTLIYILPFSTYFIFVISFTLAGFLKTKFYTKKKRLKAPKTLKMSLKKSNICIFSLNLEKFTPDRKVLDRHVCGVCDKYEVWFSPNEGKR